MLDSHIPDKQAVDRIENEFDVASPTADRPEHGARLGDNQRGAYPVPAGVGYYEHPLAVRQRQAYRRLSGALQHRRRGLFGAPLRA